MKEEYKIHTIWYYFLRPISISTADATFYEFLEVMNDAVSISLIFLMPTNKSFSSIYSCLEIRAIEVRKSRCIN